MSILTRVVATAVLARTIVGHPAIQAGLAVAPLLLTPAVRAKAREVVLTGAYGAGVVVRKVVDSTRRR